MVEITKENGKMVVDLTAGEAIPNGFYKNKVEWNMPEKVSEFEAFQDKMDDAGVDPSIGLFTMFEALHAVLGKSETPSALIEQIALTGAAMAAGLQAYIERN